MSGCAPARPEGWSARASSTTSTPSAATPTLSGRSSPRPSPTTCSKGETDLLLSAYRRHALNDADDENGYAVYLGVQCRDAAWPRDWAEWRTDTTKAHAKAPFLTWTNAWYNAPCAFWPEKAGTPVKIQSSKKLPPILLAPVRA